MQRYFISTQQMNDSSCYLEGQDAHHITNVMRFKEKDTIICCDGQGRSVVAQITELSSAKVMCQIQQELQENRELPIQVTIAQGLPKGDKMDYIVQKCTELGVHRIIPFTSTRTVVKYDGKKEAKKIDRWAKIVKEAAEQAHRTHLPVIESVRTLAQLEADTATVKLVAFEGTAGLQRPPASFAKGLQSLRQGEQLLVVIGPEGGFSTEEMEQLEAKGYNPISLGNRILRTETAAMYALAAISFYFEQMGGST